MDIKKIIREEMDDLQWMDDVNSIEDILHSGDWLIINDVDEEPNMDTLQKYLYSVGMIWVNCSDCEKGEVQKFNDTYQAIEGLLRSNQSFDSERVKPLNQFGYISPNSDLTDRLDDVTNIYYYSELINTLSNEY